MFKLVLNTPLKKKTGSNNNNNNNNDNNPMLKQFIM